MLNRLLLSLVAVAAISLAVTGATTALFSDTTSNPANTFTTGTVSLDDPAFVIADIGNLAPGDSGNQTWTVTYDGKLDAWTGLTTVLTGDLLSCAGSPFAVTITSGAQTFSSNGADQVIGTAPVSGSATSTTAIPVNVAWALDSAAGNDCQNKSATLALTMKAVQSRNNTNATSTGPTSW